MPISSGFYEQCWVRGNKPDPSGYVRASVNGRQTCAHIHAYEALVGPVPAGLELDHLCSGYAGPVGRKRQRQYRARAA